MNRFVMADPQNCIGCRTCEIACAVAHGAGNGLEGVSADNFLPRIRIVKNSTVSAPMVCRHCEDAPCAQVCPNGAIVRENDSIQVKQEKCIGCKTCAIACPYGVMAIVSRVVTLPSAGAVARRSLKVEAVKCDLCEGHAEGPSCVKVCPTNALRLVTHDGFDNLLKSKRQRAAVAEML